MNINQTQHILEVASNFCINETVKDIFEITTGLFAWQTIR